MYEALKSGSQEKACANGIMPSIMERIDNLRKRSEDLAQCANALRNKVIGPCNETVSDARAFNLGPAGREVCPIGPAARALVLIDEHLDEIGGVILRLSEIFD